MWIMMSICQIDINLLHLEFRDRVLDIQAYIYIYIYIYIGVLYTFTPKYICVDKIIIK